MRRRSMKMEWECKCGETLKGKSDQDGKYILGSVAKEYQKHMNRPDHKSSPAQWATAYERIVAGKERAKKQG